MGGSVGQPPKPPLHQSHSCKISHQHPLYVDTSLETIFFNLVTFCWGYGPLKLILCDYCPSVTHVFQVLGSSTSDYNVYGRGFTRHTGRPILVPCSLNGYRSMTGNLTTAEKATGHPTASWRWPSIMGASTCPSATLNLHATSVWVFSVTGTSNYLYW